MLDKGLTVEELLKAELKVCSQWRIEIEEENFWLYKQIKELEYELRLEKETVNILKEKVKPQ